MTARQIELNMEFCTPAGKIEYHWFIEDEGTVVLIDEKSVPVTSNGNKFTHRLAPSDNPVTIAHRLAREYRQTLGSGRTRGFGPGARISYPNRGKI